MMYCNSIYIFIVSSLFIEGVFETYPKYTKPYKQNDVPMCPYDSFVKERAEELCHFHELNILEVISKYHCLEKQTGGYIELCMEAVIVKKGFFPKWSSSEPPRIYFEECPHGFYQSRDGLSNEINKCRMKSKCSEAVGQLSSWCPDGGTINDQQCRCDFQKGYIANIYAFHNPKNQSCFTPSVENSACSFDNTCPDDKELDRAYRCVPMCPPNWHRPPEDLECKPLIINRISTSSVSSSSSEIETSETAAPSTKFLISSLPPHTKSHNGVAIAILCSVIVATVAICGIFVFLCYYRKSIHQNVKDNGEEEKILPKEVNEKEKNKETTMEEEESLDFKTREPIEIYAQDVTVNYTNIGHADNICIGDKATMMIEKK